MIQRRNAMLAGLLSPDLSKNRGEAYWAPIYVVAPYNAAKETAIFVTAGAGALPVQLPLAANNPAKVYAFKKIDVGIGTVDITANVADLIEGAPVYQLVAQYETIIIVSDGLVPAGNWWIISNI